eukprot:scaffold6247_cov416-Prasinococcus_capsulatus_cf.AAC.13
MVAQIEQDHHALSFDREVDDTSASSNAFKVKVGKQGQNGDAANLSKTTPRCPHSLTRWEPLTTSSSLPRRPTRALLSELSHTGSTRKVPEENPEAKLTASGQRHLLDFTAHAQSKYARISGRYVRLRPSRPASRAWRSGSLTDVPRKQR